MGRWLWYALMVAVFVSITAFALRANLPVQITLISVAVLLVLPTSARRGAETLSPGKFILPIFIGYNTISIVVASTQTEGLQFLYMTIGAAMFALGILIGSEQARTRSGALAHYRAVVHVPLNRLALILGVGLTLMLYLVAKHGAPILSRDVNTARLNFYPSGIYSTIIVVPLSTVMIAGGINAIENRGTRIGRLSWLMALTAFITLLVPGTRGQPLIPAATVGLYFLWARKIRLRQIIVGVVIGFLALSYLGYQRNLQAFGPTYNIDLAGEGYSGSARYLAPGLSYIGGTSTTMDTTIQYFPRIVQHPFGKEFFGPLLHKKSSDLYLKDVFGLHFVGLGLAVGAINALYLDWGWEGIVCGFLIFGWTSGYLYQRARHSGGLWIAGYVLWMMRMIFSNYGAPFAYLSDALTPLVVLLVLRSKALENPKETAREGSSDLAIPFQVIKNEMASRSRVTR